MYEDPEVGKNLYSELVRGEKGLCAFSWEEGILRKLILSLPSFAEQVLGENKNNAESAGFTNLEAEKQLVKTSLESS